MVRFLPVALTLVLLAGNPHAADLDVLIYGRPIHNTSLPSGSGMTWHADRYFVVGDDSPYLFTLNRKFAITGRTLLMNDLSQGNARIAKAIKPDYEAMAIVVWNGAPWNLIAGSGSVKRTRESGLLVSTDGKFTTHTQDMATLYRDFATLAHFSAGQTVNIEALAVTSTAAYFFNRGNADRNILFEVALSDLMAYMTGQTAQIADIRLYEAKLPRLNGLEAGFSGADYWPELDSLVYSASVEGPDNAYNDGEVLGSFLGLIPLSTLKEGMTLDLSHSAKRLFRKDVAIKSKVESVALRQTGWRRATAGLVSDNDTGSSEFFDVVLTVPHVTPRNRGLR